MHVDPVAFAVPVFIGTLAVEMVVARRRGRELHPFADTLTNLSNGMTSEVVRLGLGALGLVFYDGVYRHRLVDLSAHPWVAALLAFVGVDFLYYWYHRFCHRINVLWGLHVVHHQSQEYNLAVALRQSWFQGFVMMPIMVPLALLGVSTSLWALSFGVSLIYQFFIHTRLVGKLGVLEEVLNTPSHHRVHHAVNPEYIDKNHGAILIVWDRLFGTFAREQAEPVYGTVQPFQSLNPLWGNFDYFATLMARSRRTRRWSDKLRVWFSDPSWLPEDLGGPKLAPPVEAASFVKWRLPLSPRLHGYLRAQLLLTAAVLGAALIGRDLLPTELVVAAGALTLLSALAWSGIFEGRSWALAIDLLRLLGLGALAGLAFSSPPLWPALGLSAVVVVGSLWWLTRVAPHFGRPEALAGHERGADSHAAR
jgi:alkylglycerol monooxygenase